MAFTTPVPVASRSTFATSACVSTRPQIPRQATTIRAVQSPINVPSAGNVTDPLRLAPVIESGHVVFLEAERDGDNFHMNVERGSEPSLVVFNGLRYFLTQVHVHTPSENLLDGEQFDMEMHLVHESSRGRICVLAMLLDQSGDDNPELEKMLQAMNEAAEEDGEDDDEGDDDDKDDCDDDDDHEHDRDEDDKFIAKVDISRMLRDSIQEKNLITFDGSLTTFPFDEGVQWIVSKKPIIASRRQIQCLYKGIDGVVTPNNRELQDPESRRIAQYA